MMIVLDYYGYRIVAEAALPIRGNTICYGSDDACRTIHNSDSTLENYARQVANHVNLKRHKVGEGATSAYKKMCTSNVSSRHLQTTQVLVASWRYFFFLCLVLYELQSKTD
jgi:hypothetical protein